MSETEAAPSADPSTQPPELVAARLDVNPDTGLSAAEAARRLAEHGANALRATAGPSLWRRIVAQFQDPLVYLLLGAAAVALIAWAVEREGGWPIDAIVILAVLLLNATLGFVEESKAADAAAALARMTQVTSSVLRDGRRRRIPSTELVPGDIMLLEEGDAVGADARLIAAATLRVQEASLTGESEAVSKDVAPLTTPAPLADRTSMVFKGTAVAQGTGRAVVTATGMDTQMGAIATMLDATEGSKTPLEQEVARIGRMLGIAVLAIAAMVVASVFAISEVHGFSDVVAVLLLGVSLAVAAVPEGLPAILSLVLALGVQRMAARKAVVKRLSSVETLGAATVICSDKTGTLTRSQMTIQRIVTASGDSHVAGVGYVPEGAIVAAADAPVEGALKAEHIVVLSGGSLAGNADLHQAADGTWEIQGDPTEAAFLVAEKKLGADRRRRTRFERVAELPFTSERKMMSTIARDMEHGGELVLVAKGAPDVLMQRCNRVRVGMDVLGFDAVHRARAADDVERLSGEALRTLAVAYRPLAQGEERTLDPALERDLIFVGTVGIIDPPREEAAVAIAEAHRAGIRVVMITGDHPRTAARIAALLGIAPADAPALTGTDLDALDETQFARAVRETSVFARVAPVHKLRIVDALQAGGAVVAMTGDGVNDAPALKSADIGIAMGVTGTEVTKEAAKMILADDNFATIVAAVREGRAIFDNIRKFLRYLLSSNMGEVLTVFLGVIGAGILGLNEAGDGTTLVAPLLATQILWINLITDSGPALAMGIDPETDDVMARPPRRAGEPAIDAAMWRGVLEMGLVMAVATLVTIDLFLPGGLFEGQHDLERARTAGFTVLVLAQLFNCFNARSETASAFHHLFANRWLWGAVILSALLQVAVVHLPLLNTAFGTKPLSGADWLLCLGMGSAVLWFAELRKWLLRRLTAVPAIA
ncbi:cation-translocating P-type ATPase [Sphingomonas desiccabilis]|uniref:Cation-translocating P-type ATPase n=1 Tax=Sphingomonas desiccabilis TaxID=429134 RepID=A0A4Q2IQJ4_9SPHN|nr:cation-translocating P-type ATPase [Sphingomonas desiccabilis]MBB3912368.1 potassium/sodium efflux P-type ATPase [Sphingomonas desiccabilis]RXZ30504.1 cation-translocating P-type ATPase [Sphingomonas desiccabilis]